MGAEIDRCEYDDRRYRSVLNSLKCEYDHKAYEYTDNWDLSEEVRRDYERYNPSMEQKNSVREYLSPLFVLHKGFMKLRKVNKAILYK